MGSRTPQPFSRILAVVLGFALLCALVLIGSAKMQGRGHGTGKTAAWPKEDTVAALEDTAKAEAALRDKNYGAARLHVQRARVRLEHAVSEMNEAGD